MLSEEFQCFEVARFKTPLVPEDAEGGLCRGGPSEQNNNGPHKTRSELPGQGLQAPPESSHVEDSSDTSHAQRHEIHNNTIRTAYPPTPFRKHEGALKGALCLVM